MLSVQTEEPRQAQQNQYLLEVGDRLLKVVRDPVRCFLGEEELTLTPQRGRLLELFVFSGGKTITIEEAYDVLRKDLPRFKIVSREEKSRLVKVVVCRLRDILGEANRIVTRYAGRRRTLPRGHKREQGYQWVETLDAPPERYKQKREI